MITSLEQCTAIQTRRVAAKRRGYAKRVRNFIGKNHSSDYKALIKALPVTWVKPVKVEGES